MDIKQAANEVLVNLFNHILDIEEKNLITEEFLDVTNNDMHIMAAIGIAEPKSMSMVAKELSVTLGTLSTAVNSLVKKDYIMRSKYPNDGRVVLVSLTDKGRSAFARHQSFHEDMIKALIESLDEGEQKVLVEALLKLTDYFKAVLERQD